MLQMQFEVTTAEQGQRLGVFLRNKGVSAGCIKSVKYQGDGFYADGDPIHTNVPVCVGQKITFTLPPEPVTGVAPQPMKIEIAYEDDFAVVLNKPAGIAVHPTLNYPDGTLANGWLYLMQQRGETGVFRPVNRIDKNTSGLVLCAKNAYAAPLLAKSASKCYLALAEGELPLGKSEFNAPIGRRADSIIGRCVCNDGKPSITGYDVLCAKNGYALLACEPITGRTHQIRVHASYTGHPLAGDTLYGGHFGLMQRHALHCAVLRFQSPALQQIVRVQCALPKDMTDACDKLGLYFQLQNL